MLTQVCDGVFVRQSAFCLSNAIVVLGNGGALLIDPGVSGADLAELATGLDDLGVGVAAGFATHPHWDHVLWHPRFGAAPRWGTARCAAASRDRITDSREKVAHLAPDVPRDLVGAIDPLPGGADHLRWDGPGVRIVEHDAHAPGHAALLIEQAGVLVVGDMLSDVEIPLLDLQARDPAGDYDRGLRALALAAAQAAILIPGHGGVARGDEIDRRIAQDRHYLEQLRGNGAVVDPRIGPRATYGRDWLPREHEDQLVAVRSGRV